MSGLSFILAHQIITEFTEAPLANCETVVHRRYTLNRSESETPLVCLMHLNIPRIKFFSSEGELGTKKVQSSEYFE